MMEEIVRPFASPGGLATQRIVVQRDQVPVEPATLTWGQAGQMPTALEQDSANDDGTYGFKLIVCDEALSEDTRSTENQRIENPDDPNQYVVVQRVRSMKFRKEERQNIVGSIRTETTTFPDLDLWWGSPFGQTIKPTEQCRSQFNFKA